MTSERITVGIIMPLGSQVGGSEALLGHLLRHKSTTHRYVCAFLQDGTLAEDARKLGYDTVVFPATRLSKPSNYFQVVNSLRAWIKEKRPSVVVSWMSKGHLYAGLAARFLPAKVIWFQHTVPVGNAPYLRLVTLIPAAAIFCCSETVKKSQDLLFPGRTSHVCYPGVVMPADNSPTLGEAREQLGLPPASPVIGMVARLERWKGAHIFVEAAASILRQFPDATLFIVGGAHSRDPAYAEEIRDGVAALHCEGRFILAGQRPMDEAILWQTAADIIVHPVTGVEPFGMSVVEAMAQSKVVVTNDKGGPAEVIRNGFSGILIESSNAPLLASSVVELLHHPEKRKAIEKEAYIRGRSFSIEAFVARFEGLIQKVLAV